MQNPISDWLEKHRDSIIERLEAQIQFLKMKREWAQAKFDAKMEYYERKFGDEEEWPEWAEKALNWKQEALDRLDAAIERLETKLEDLQNLQAVEA